MPERIARSLCRSQATALRTADFKQWPGISCRTTYPSFRPQL